MRNALSIRAYPEDTEFVWKLILQPGGGISDYSIDGVGTGSLLPEYKEVRIEIPRL